MKITTGEYGIYNGKTCKLFTITDPGSGAQVTVTDLGAALLRVVRPDKNGKLIDIALTQDNPEELISCKGYLGATVGRFANRIGYGKFELDGTQYKLEPNNGPHVLHGGFEGFHKRLWEVVEQEESENEVRLGFKYESPDLESGFPGSLISRITYHFEPNKVWWEIEASANRPTILNLTNHTYWNLEGLQVKIDDQEIEIAAGTYFPGDENSFPTGEIRQVEPTLDMRTSRKFSDIFQKFGDVDNNFFLDEAKKYSNQKSQRELHYCARAFSTKTGISMTLHTTEPCVQLYTGNWVQEMKTYNGGLKAEKHDAFCLETQRPPDAINNPAFRDLVVLRPEEVYYHKTVHEFGRV